MHSVPFRMYEGLVILLESRRMHGGKIEEHKWNDSTGLMTVTFEDKNGLYCEVTLR